MSHDSSCARMSLRPHPTGDALVHLSTGKPASYREANKAPLEKRYPEAIPCTLPAPRPKSPRREPDAPSPMSTLIYFAVPFFLLLLLLECGLTRGRDILGYEPRDTAASLSIGVANVVIAAGTKAATLAIYVFLHHFAIFDIRDQWWALPAAMLADDFAYYWFHRLSHEVRFLWAAHVNHHSSQRYNLSTALRQSWTTPFTGPVFWMPLALIGFDPAADLHRPGDQPHLPVLDPHGADRSHGAPGVGVQHALPPPGAPRSQRRVPRPQPRRHPDRLGPALRHLRARAGARVEYGLTKNIHTFNPVKIAFHEWADMSARCLRGRNALARCASLPALASGLEPRRQHPHGRTSCGPGSFGNRRA